MGVRQAASRADLHCNLRAGLLTDERPFASELGAERRSAQTQALGPRYRGPSVRGKAKIKRQKSKGKNKGAPSAFFFLVGGAACR